MLEAISSSGVLSVCPHCHNSMKKQPVLGSHRDLVQMLTLKTMLNRVTASGVAFSLSVSSLGIHFFLLHAVEQVCAYQCAIDMCMAEFQNQFILCKTGTWVALYLFSMHCAGCTGSILLHEYCVHFRDEEWALNSHFEYGIIDSPVMYVFIKHSMFSS